MVSPTLVWAAQQLSNIEGILATIGSLIMGAATLLGILKGLNSQAKNEEGHKVLQEELLSKITDLNNKLRSALIDSEVKQQQYIDSQNRLLEITERLNNKQHELANALHQLDLMKREIEIAGHQEHLETRKEVKQQANETQKIIKEVDSKLSGQEPAG